MPRFIAIVALVLVIVGFTSASAQDERTDVSVLVRSEEFYLERDRSSCEITSADLKVLKLRLKNPETGGNVFTQTLDGGTEKQIYGSNVCEVLVTASARYLPEYQLVIRDEYQAIAVVDQMVTPEQLGSGELTFTIESREDEAKDNPEDSREPAVDPAIGEVPVVPTVTEAWRVTAVPGSSEDLLNEPLLFVFDVYGFDSEETAEAEFESLADWYVEFWSVIGEDTATYDYREVSIGRLGDERVAFVSTNVENPPFLITLIRVGSTIQVTSTMTLGGDITEFVGGFLEEFVADADGDPLSLVPEIADLPRGWSVIPEDGPLDLLPAVNPDAAGEMPEATPEDD